MAEKPSPGSWKLRDLKDTRQNVIEAIQSAAFVPDKAKEFLLDEIEKVPANVRLIRVDVQCQAGKLPKGFKSSGHWDISEV